jgi:hypothetical protein
MRKLLAALSLATSLLGGCYARTYGPGYGPGYGATAVAVGPSLEYVSPGVQVVADYDYPVFYSDNYYWRYDGGMWYRSGYHNGGWQVWGDVPVAVRGIDRPYSYAHYRGNGGYRGNSGYRAPAYQPGYRGPVVQPGGYRGPAQPAYRGQPPAQPVVRDHRAAPVPMARPAAPPPAPVRDHRR